jgi:dTMP kinase
VAVSLRPIPAPLIAIEGIDGGGKSTQARRLVATLCGLGFDARYTKEPTDGPFGRRLRQSASTGRLPVQEEMALFLSDRREHVRDELDPWRASGVIGVIDRYFYSSVAYQGVRGLDPAEILAANVAFAPVPDLLVVLDIDTSDGLARVQGRGQPDEFERFDLLDASARLFRRMGGLRLDALAPADDVAAIVLDRAWRVALAGRLPGAVHASLSHLAWSHPYPPPILAEGPPAPPLDEDIAGA